MKRDLQSKPDMGAEDFSPNPSREGIVSPLVETDFESLLKQVQAGSESAAWTLVETYGPHILRSVRRLVDHRLRGKLDSQDFVQAVWASVFARPQRLLAMRQPEELIAYLAVITRNNVIEEARRQKNVKKRAISRERSMNDSAVSSDAMGQRSGQPSPSEVAIARERWERMAENHPPHYRRIIVLRLHGHTYQSIADELGLSERTVRRVLSQLLHDCVSENARTKFEEN
ncbi:MAG: sigma-70 family RNA polymerase sigma factor [Planctomycetes bacterium]|nr:sigma-70 family RNA polymerase sigma factor [Planctomycetota bacterium]